MSENVQATSSPMADAPSKRLSARYSSKKLNAAIIAAAVVTVVGLALWALQLTGGMVQTGMRNLDSWGLYITCFMFFIGLSAGGLIISSIPNALGMKDFGGISKVAIWTSICSTVVAVGFVVVDLGNPLRLWELFVYSNLASPLMWDLLVISTYLILSVVYLWAYFRAEKGLMSHVAIRAISVIALVVAVLVHTVTAWIFALAPAHEFWHTALMGPWFVVSALDCGTALVLIVCIALRRTGYLELSQENVVKLAKMLAVFVCVDVYFFACDLLTSGYFGAEGGAEVVAMLLTGQLAPFFWCQMACMAVAVVLLVIPSLRNNMGVVMASVLTIVGVFLKRCQILLGGFQVANIDMAGPATSMTVINWEAGVSAAYQGLIYFPTAIEFGIAIAVVALGALMLMLGLKYLPLKPSSEE